MKVFTIKVVFEDNEQQDNIDKVKKGTEFLPNSIDTDSGTGTLRFCYKRQK